MFANTPQNAAKPSTSRVIIVTGKDPYQNTWQILSAAGKNFIDGVRSPLLIKPNLAYEGKRPGITTDPQVVKAIVDFVQKYVSLDKILIGESSSKNTLAAYDKLGYTAIFKDYGLEMLDFNQDESVDFEIADPLTGAPVTIQLSKTALNCSTIISCALLKTHDHGIATFTLKNMMGVIVGTGPKISMHGKYPHEMTNAQLKRSVPGFHQNIAALVRQVMPDFAVIDGIVGLEGNGPIDGTPRRMGLALGGFDPVAVDAVAAYLIGFDPLEIGYIYLCERLGLGTADLSKIAVTLDNWTRLRQSFKPHERYSLMTYMP